MEYEPSLQIDWKFGFGPTKNDAFTSSILEQLIEIESGVILGWNQLVISYCNNHVPLENNLWKVIFNYQHLVSHFDMLFQYDFN
jgi:hypothetical protein